MGAPAATETGASAALSSPREVIPSFGNTRYRCVLIVRCEREQPLADLAVREPLGGELGDLQLLGGQLVARLGDAPPAALARRAQLAPRLLAPRCAAERVEGVARGAQDGA